MIADPGPEEPLAPSDEHTAHPHRLRILLVEDDADTAESLALLLRLLGHEVHVAKDGSEAMRQTEANLPDLVFLDIGLPGMDGWEVARRLHQVPGGRAPLLVAITGYGQEADRERSQEAGIHLHLVKPVDPPELEELLRRFQTILKG
jgi:CheY-like chemotaxis protein